MPLRAGHQQCPTTTAKSRCTSRSTPKISDPLLTSDIEAATHRELRKRCLAEPGVFVHEIGGVETHVHLALTLPPTLTISEFIGRLKGGVSHDVNARFARSDKALEWQSGCGVVSFGTGDLV